ncbi:MAG: TPM domain-containing protein [Geitlerinemataceae cyanobacterium]
MQQVIYKLQLLLLSGVVFFFLLLPTFPGLALSVGDVPNPRRIDGGWVTDMAGVLSDPTEQQLNRTIAQFEDRTTIEIAVVTVKTTQPSPSPKAFTTELFNTWGIGKARHNNGLLFLIATEDRRVEIETGSGLESLLPSSTLQALLASEITPKLSQGNFDGGTLSGTQALIETLYHQISASPLGGSKSAVVGFSQLLWRMLLTASMAIGFTAICIFLYRQYQNYRDRQTDRHLRRFVGPATVMERGWAVMLDVLTFSELTRSIHL